MRFVLHSEALTNNYPTVTRLVGAVGRPELRIKKPHA